MFLFFLPSPSPPLTNSEKERREGEKERRREGEKERRREGEKEKGREGDRGAVDCRGKRKKKKKKKKKKKMRERERRKEREKRLTSFAVSGFEKLIVGIFFCCFHLGSDGLPPLLD